MNQNETIVCEIAYKDDPEITHWVNIALYEQTENDANDGFDDIFFYAPDMTKEDLMRLYNRDTTTEDWFIVDIV